MKFLATADTDIGISKNVNQDSLLIKHATYSNVEVLMAIVCDGMGGLSKGELASATVIRAFSSWFETDLSHELENLNMEVIGGKWSLMLKDLNVRILEYSKTIGESMGTTFTGLLFVDNDYLIVHVGDSRAYHIGTSLKQLTDDQTFVAREISKGTMTVQQAKSDKRRNLLLQCVGASKVIEPQVIYGKTQKGAYMLCSDGFRNEITESEIYKLLNPKKIKNKNKMHRNIRHLINKVKSREEKDNITALLIKVS